MQTLKQFLPILLLAILEIVIGIFLFVNPEGFTRVVIIIFGIVLLLIGIRNLIQFFRGRKNGSSGALTMVLAILALVIGAICLFASGVIINLIAVIAAVYGIILIIAGCFKLYSFAETRGAGIKNAGTILMLISGIIMLVFGIILVFHPFGTLEVLLKIGGVLLIIEAVLDLISIFIAMKNAPRQVN